MPRKHLLDLTLSPYTRDYSTDDTMTDNTASVRRKHTIISRNMVNTNHTYVNHIR